MTMVKTAFVIFVLAGSALAFRQNVKLVAEEFVERVNNLDEEASNVQRVGEEVAEASLVERVNNLDEEASNVQASSPQEDRCLALVDKYEDHCRAANTEDVCDSARCFWGQAYETGRCWPNNNRGEECVHTNSKSYCQDQPGCFWRSYESDDMGHYDFKMCLPIVPTWEVKCRPYPIDKCPSSHCFKRGGYETGKCWSKASGSDSGSDQWACRLWNAKSDCEAETGSLGSSTGSPEMGMPAVPTVGKCFWGQGYEKGKCLTRTNIHESYYASSQSMCLKSYTKEGCPDQSCYWEE